MIFSRSIEERVEDIYKRQLDHYGVKYYSKTDKINSEIAAAMKKAPSKKGNPGGNYPDIRCLIQTHDRRTIPVMIEVKGRKGYLIKTKPTGEIDNYTQKGENNYANISAYAVNGAVHYAKALIDFTESYKEIIAIGANGYKGDGEIKCELGVYLVSADNLSIPKKVGDYSDLSFLMPENFDHFMQRVDRLRLTQDELEAERRKVEEKIESNLKSLNQAMQDDLKISVGSRVELITGMIMAGLGVKDKVAPLQVSDLKGELGGRNNDGEIILDKIQDFLTERDLPTEKKDMIVNDLARVFRYADLSKPESGESKLKTVYIRVKSDILPFFYFVSASRFYWKVIQRFK